MADRVGISRRRVLKGAAWTTPVVLIATASPPAAASVIGGDIDDIVGGHTEGQGNTDYVNIGLSLSGMSVTNMTVRVQWTHAAETGASVTISGGGTGWTPAGLQASTDVTFTAAGTVSSNVLLTFQKGKTARVTVSDGTSAAIVFDGSLQ
ncbi:hypothetical protein [Demequina rhizosphaerae]|uniref:hypothetical protein n=1 Tax=Demequina rhizosphaerae TaxID=1638985 RepID=UPI0012E096B9|nr:hypothetical protein [Demequina rhizosphaerae]